MEGEAVWQPVKTAGHNEKASKALERVSTSQSLHHHSPFGNFESLIKPLHLTARLLFGCPTRMPGILAAHGPRAFGEALAVGIDGIGL